MISRALLVALAILAVPAAGWAQPTYALKVKPTWVPFNGGNPAMQALVAGQVDYVCGDGLTSGPQVRLVRPWLNAR